MGLIVPHALAAGSCRNTPAENSGTLGGSFLWVAVERASASRVVLANESRLRRMIPVPFFRTHSTKETVQSGAELGPICVSQEYKMAIELSDPIKIILAILLPPLGVFFEVGLGLHFWLNIVLTFCGYVPGIVHALIVILAK
jgi:uncharacterized membrane protein YqaE (UPF0057 family)